MVERLDSWDASGLAADDRIRPSRRQRLRRLAIILAVLAALTAAGLWVGDQLFGVHGPSHYVSITNDTGADLNWSCSWSDLRLAPGETGELRILDQPDQDYGCVPQPTSHRADICPKVGAMIDGASFTATGFAERYRCP
ncbi:hypothetical protein [Rathayibacter agropyri]|uniref:hypothetical protein n=1 Tax=Rathayibacter agropyri TaxID=1634927 RepID=UPI00156564A6|nr:hypothetical protein [Rathayibacter agropyri]NRD10084.1 hypothetical protein [Rathayibacter agropyri]